eukprot:scaffold35799_cov80-Phaeocystis_antarctica.AAC.3
MGTLGECPELGGETGGTTIQYYVGGEARIDDESGFGLDAYEPLFFNSQDWWGAQTAFKVTLTIPTTAPFTKIYYFCHIHAGMSAEIEITGSAGGNVLNPATLGGEDETSALKIFDDIKSGHQKSIAAFDQACGTYDVSGFSEHATCAGKNFLCGEGAGDHYSKCLQAVDCKMHHDMAVSVEAGASKFATFARQMIPHHQNAVAMTKVLLKHHTAADYANAGAADPDEEDDHAAAEGLGREIINAQNAQIQQMSGWLEANGGLAMASSQCYADSPIGAVATTSVHSHAVSPGTMPESGVACTPASNTLMMKWNAHASEWGAYTIDGCTGVNPKLTLGAGTEYTFDQSHASNWYHPVGFAYIAGGAHTKCKNAAMVVGECPELGGEAAGTTIQYYVNAAAVNNDESTFGLDAYEPLFFNSQDWWGAQAAFKVTLNIPVTAPFTKIYYFCHIHAGMSAEIEITGSAGGMDLNILNPAALGGEDDASAKKIFTDIQAAEQKTVSTYDQACGTYNTYAADTKSSCSNSHFLCGDGAGGDYETCLGAIDCKMHHDMAVSVPAGASKFATFARQMIPHHQNAVSMAKSLIKFHTAEDYANAGATDPEVEDDHAAAEALARNIINVQNAQIQMLAGWLEANPDLAMDSHKCYDQVEGATCTGGTHECAAGTHCECAVHSRRNLLFASIPMGHKSCKCHSD